jgi:hypothetical protein
MSLLQGSGGWSQLTPAQGSAAQSPVFMSQPPALVQSTSLCMYEQAPASQAPLGENCADVLASVQEAAGGVLHGSTEPAQAPAALQASADVHASPSSHEAPAGLREYEQVPPAQVPTGTWHCDGGASHAMPAHGSSLHRPVASLQPVGQATSVEVKVHCPSAPEQAPPLETREPPASHTGTGGMHTTAPPVHFPAPSHASAVVQRFPSSQGVAAAFWG